MCETIFSRLKFSWHVQWRATLRKIRQEETLLVMISEAKKICSLEMFYFKTWHLSQHPTEWLSRSMLKSKNIAWKSWRSFWLFFRSSRMARIRERLGSRSSEYFSDFSNKQNHVSSNGSRVFYGRGYATAKNRRRHLSISWHFAPFDAKVYQFCHYVWDLLSIYKTVVRYDRS